MKSRNTWTLLVASLMLIGEVAEAQVYPTPVEGDFVVNDFPFEEGGKLSRLNLHYITIGQPSRNADGRIDNAVLILHGTAGNAKGFLNEQFADNLFAAGKVLDAGKYFIVMPDSIGHGESSRPSDGMRMDFPNYSYKDMVVAQHRLLTEHLGIDHLRLVTGTSMGGMHTWMWGYMYPDFMDALLPLASTPVAIAGRNRMMRKMIVDAIKDDPDWNNGNYEQQPRGLRYAMHPLIFMISSPLQYQSLAPSRESAEQLLAEWIESYSARMEANDLIYQFEASRYYDPSPELGRISAPLVAINSADDEVNPPELGFMEREIKKVKSGKYVLLPITDETTGHATYMTSRLWESYLEELMDASRNKN